MIEFIAGATVAFGTVVAHKWLKAVRRVPPPTNCDEAARRAAYLTALAESCGNHTFDKGMREEFDGFGIRGRDADFWDIAQADEPGRVAYRFLGVTGEER